MKKQLNLFYYLLVVFILLPFLSCREKTEETIIDWYGALYEGEYQAWHPYLEKGTKISGEIKEDNGNPVNFYIINESDFEKWENGEPITPLAQFIGMSYIPFEFQIEATGYYCFILDNTGGTTSVWVKVLVKGKK